MFYSIGPSFNFLCSLWKTVGKRDCSCFVDFVGLVLFEFSYVGVCWSWRGCKLAGERCKLLNGEWLWRNDMKVCFVKFFGMLIILCILV